MKKLLKFLLVLCFTIGLFGNAYAQVPTTIDATQTGVIADGTYTYTVPNTTGQSWTWTVINSVGTIIAPGADYAMVNVADYEKSITWKTSGTFYVLVEAKIDLTGCTNQYAIQVDVATNDYVVAFNAATEKTYCADDANITSGMEITLDITLAGATPAVAYYDMTVHYQVDGGSTELATIGVGHKFNIPGMTIADPVSPAFTSVTVTILKVVDKNGVEFSPAVADYVITINPIPGKPTIIF
ncbi:MAG: hypothetical protein JXR82_04680 [Marinifilaceae bacterium]|nr:hypothetical protein [Marinifilaceae bacterium]